MPTKYRATRALGYRRRRIGTGEVVPSDYPRFEEAKRRGWIVKDSPATVLSPVKSGEEIVDSPKVELPPVKEDEVIEEGISESVNTEPTEETEEEQEQVTGPIIMDLDFLKPEDEPNLTEAGLITIADLEGWNYDQLVDIRGIGKSKANQLLDAFAKYDPEL